MVGCSKRMGQDWRPIQAISVKSCASKSLDKTDERAREAGSPTGRERWFLAGTYFCICFVLSFRSPEGLMADLEGIIRFFGRESSEVVVALLVGPVQG